MIVIIIILQHLRMFKPEMPLVQEQNRVDELVMTEPKRASHIFLLNVLTASTQHRALLAQSVEHETLISGSWVRAPRWAAHFYYWLANALVPFLRKSSTLLFV